MSRRIHRTPGGQRRSGTGRYCKGVATGTRMYGPGGSFEARPVPEIEAQDAPEKEKQDDETL